MFIALSLTGVAAYFSIIGLTAVYIGATIPIIIFASIFELGKIACISALYRYGKLLPLFIKSMCWLLVVVVMFVTSLGVFGFLSRAYIQHSADTQFINIESNRIQEQVDTLTIQRDRAQNTLNQINDSLNTLIEFNRISGPNGYRAVRENQQPEIDELESIIANTNSLISNLTQEKLTLERDIRAAEAEVGVIRFVAEMIYGEENAQDNYDRSVRILTIILLIICDPFAIMMLILANHLMMLRSNNDRSQHDFNNDSSNEPNPIVESTKDDSVLDKSVDLDNNESIVKDEIKVESKSSLYQLKSESEAIKGPLMQTIEVESVGGLEWTNRNTPARFMGNKNAK